MTIILIYIAIGIVTGILSGFFGIGGGLVIVPALAIIFTSLHFSQSVVMHMATGTSLMIIIITSISAIMSHHKHGTIRWSIAKKFLPGLVVGVLCGVLISRFLPAHGLRIAFVIYLLVIALKILRSTHQGKNKKFLPGVIGSSAIGSIIGAFSSMIGCSTGSMFVPYLNHHNIPMSNAAGTTAIFNLSVATIGAIGAIFNGWYSLILPRYAIGYIYWPAVINIAISSFLFVPLGAKLVCYVPSYIVKRMFGIFLLLVALSLLYN